MTKESQREQARRRAEMILKVRGGQLTAQEAARALGVSRKTYYKWEQRGLAAMLEGLCERSSGRPASQPDGEKESLKQTVGQLEIELKDQEQRRQIRDRLKADAEKKGG